MRAEPCFGVNFDMFVTGAKLTANDNHEVGCKPVIYSDSKCMAN
jgi:hypothetical protein